MTALVSPAAVASLAWHAVPAWLAPPRHLHDRVDRMRASVSTTLLSWCLLAGFGLVFVQLTQFQGFAAPGQPEVRWAYAVFDVALAASALVAVTGLCLGSRDFAGYHHSTLPAGYLILVTAVALVNTVSAARGTRAALAKPRS